MAVVNITVENDADFYRTFQYVMSSAGTPIDMTGATLEMMLRRHAEDAEAVMRLATDTGEIVMLDPVNGLFSVLIRQEDLERLGLGSFDHSNIMTQGVINGIPLKTKIWSGTLVNNAGPTR
jgi:hypothetical protein